MHDKVSVLCALGDERQRAFICDQLAADGYPVEPARSSAELQLRARNRAPGVLLLGRLERRHDELRLLRSIRAGNVLRADVDPAVAVIVLGAEAGELAMLRAFAAGCDDFLACPPGYPELRARIEALARRAGVRRPQAPRRAPHRPTAASPATPASPCG
jgi:DNA-binding response OmpR family regulator